MRKVDVVLTVATVALAAVGGYLMYTGLGSPRIELGNLADWLSALAAASAAIVALRIATRDRAERHAERVDEQKTRARLVRLSASPDNRGGIIVKVRNFGPLPVIDVELVSDMG